MADKTEDTIHFLVITPDRVFLETEAYSVTIPATDGGMGIMHGHEPRVVSITPGTVTVRDGEGVRHFFAAEGYCEISQSLVLIICNSAEWPDDISVRRIFESYKKACDRLDMQNKDRSKVYPNDAQYMKQRALARMRLIENYGSESKKKRLAEFRGE